MINYASKLFWTNGDAGVHTAWKQGPEHNGELAQNFNNFRPVKTPGGKLVLHLIKKHTRGTGMQGVKVARPNDFRRMTSSRRTVSRAYGGILTGLEVRERIMRAFLIEEFRYYKKE